MSMKLSLDDAGLHLRFAPLSLSKPIGALRCGIWTNQERWNQLLPDASIFYQTESYLEKKFPATKQADWIVNASIIPTKKLIEAIESLPNDAVLVNKNTWLAKKSKVTTKEVLFGDELIELTQVWDLFQQNGLVLKADFIHATTGKTSAPLSPSNTIIGDPTQIFLDEGVQVEGATLNTKEGPIYLGKDAEVMEGALIRGPFALGEAATVKMGAKIYGPTTIGPHCKVGGEISNVIFQAYSNKGHDGFLGNSVIGEWCNLGADTNSSNLKNNYSLIKAYSYEKRQVIDTGLQFMGLIMGDHSKCGINTMFNTATVVGVSCNIYGGDFPEKHIPSFSWGGPPGFVPFTLNKAIQAAEAMMARRAIAFTAGDRIIFEYLFNTDDF